MNGNMTGKMLATNDVNGSYQTSWEQPQKAAPLVFSVIFSCRVVHVSSRLEKRSELNAELLESIGKGEASHPEMAEDFYLDKASVEG